MNKLNKRLLYLVGILFLILSIASCKKEEAPKAATTATQQDPVESFQFIRVVIDGNLATLLPIDSISYLNKKTNATQTLTNIVPTLHTCTGVESEITDLNLIQDYVETDSCTITVYFTPSPEYKALEVYILKTGEDECVGAAPYAFTYGFQNTFIIEMGI